MNIADFCQDVRGKVEFQSDQLTVQETEHQQLFHQAVKQQEVNSWEGNFDKHHVLCSIYPRAIKGGSGHNDVWGTAAEVGGGAVGTYKLESKNPN